MMRGCLWAPGPALGPAQPRRTGGRRWTGRNRHSASAPSRRRRWLALLAVPSLQRLAGAPSGAAQFFDSGQDLHPDPPFRLVPSGVELVSPQRRMEFGLVAVLLHQHVCDAPGVERMHLGFGAELEGAEVGQDVGFEAVAADLGPRGAVALEVSCGVQREPPAPVRGGVVETVQLN